MSDVVIRDATREDLEGIVDVYRQCFARNGLVQLGRRTCLRHFDEVLTREGYRLLVAEEAGRTIGMAMLVLRPGARIKRITLLRSPGVWWEIAGLALGHPGRALGYFAKAARAAVGLAPKRNDRTLPAAERFAGASAVWLHHLGVSPSVQGRGVGSQLLAYIRRLSKDLGFECIKLHVDNDNARAMALYEKRGFVRTLESQREFTYALDCT